MTYRAFAGRLSFQAAAALEDAGRVVAFRSRQEIYRQGHPGGDVALMLDGWVKVVSAAATGVEVILALRGPGDLLGELPAFDGGRRSATVRALGRVRARMIPGPEFRAIAGGSPALAFALIEHLAHRLRESDARRVEYASTTTLQRVARRIQEFAEADGRPLEPGAVVPLRLNRAEFAEAASVSPRMLMRALGLLRERGVIISGRRQITILIPHTLRLVAEDSGRSE
jgi:CRP-like cAMP-binding protein